MRKTLFALLGLVAIGIWAVPALAVPAIGDQPKVLLKPIPLENRASGIGALARNNYQATLSGTTIKQTNVTTSWFLYPGACLDRQNGLPGTLGTWVPRSSEQADSLNTYPVGSQSGYGRFDLSLSNKIFGVVDAATPVNERPAILTGSRSIWCGFYDPNGVYPVGYPNLTQQILMIDLESNRTPISAATGTYTISMKMNMSLEQNYDFLYLIGGGNWDGGTPNGFGDEDPLGNSRGPFDQIRASGSFNGSTLQAVITGSVTSTNPLSSTIVGASAPTIVAEGASQPEDRTLNLVMTTDNRTLYIVVTADCLYSSHDGLWGFGKGVILDDITVTDTANPTPRVMYDEQTAAGGLDVTGGDILVADPITGTETDGVRISARIFPGKGELWAIQAGNDYATGADICASKSIASDHFFLGCDPVTKKVYPGQFNSVVSCTFPIPAGTADILGLWGEYLNMPRTSGFFQDSEYRYFKDGEWSNWVDTDADKSVNSGVEQWFLDGNQLAQAVQAESLQVRYNIRCIPFYAADQTNCDANTEYGALYDDLYIRVTEGVPAPIIGIFPGAVAQTTFVDGTMTGTNCTVTPCWPGIRGTDLLNSPNPDVQRSAVRDNVNSTLGDSLTMAMVTGLRKNGMGINWHFGFDKSVNGGLTIAYTNGAYDGTKDTPRVIYRLFDPATTSWSPWDSTSLDATAVSVSADTVVIDSEYRMNWPPRDKAAQVLPGGFTINGEANYDNLDFLPRGTRMQYYFKAVDINGGTTYAFGAGALARETEDLPTLPGSSIVAPDIQEFGVLPRKYPVGTGGTLVAGRTDTPILNLDNTYAGWDYQQDPVTHALRAMGVRADRYRFLGSGDEGHGVGGHELTGDRPHRLSNYFPNIEEYGIVDSLRAWYRIIIENTHDGTAPAFHEQDAQLISDWASTPTNSNDGDRCLFLTGDDASNAATNAPAGVNNARKLSLSINVFGVSNVTTLAPSAGKGAWAGTGVNFYPTIDDQFAAQASGPGLAPAGSFTYELDGGCAGPNRFDPLTATGGAFAAAKYPVAAGVTDVAGVAKASEFDTPADLDQVKTLAYGFSIQFVRGAPNTIPRNAANYVRSGVQNRMQILYKFLTGCRGARGSGSLCWPCPTDATLMSNWAGATGFNTATYGPLMPIQDFTKATGIGVEEVSEAPRANQLFGNSPNPFNPRTQIKFAAAQPGKVTIRIFNVAGQLVRTLETKVDKAGPASVYWDGKSDRNIGAGSGVYFYKATFANGATLRADRSMVLVK